MKPPYEIPSMAEINAAPRNGLKVISTFAGAGGSSLGYRMAGYKILASSEFVTRAADVYELNAVDGTVVIRDDIREVTGTQIMKRVGIGPGDLDVLDGSPPCSAFSAAGKGSAGWGLESDYSDTRQRVDDLFFEFARVLGEIQPRAFVAENVAGLGRGESQGYFIRIFRELEAQGYRVKAKVLDAKWLGVPMSRNRLIFVGVRNDQPFEPVHPKPLPYFYTLADALPHIVGQVESATGNYNLPGWRPATRKPSSCIGSEPGMPSGNYPASLIESSGPVLEVDEESGGTLIAFDEKCKRQYPQRQLRRLTMVELRRICSFPADFQLQGTYTQRWERLGRAVPPLMMKAIAATLAKELLRD